MYLLNEPNAGAQELHMSILQMQGLHPGSINLSGFRDNKD